MTGARSARQGALWDRAAAGYDGSMALLERRWLSGYRARLLQQATGRVIEAGIGTGANLPHYPAGVRLSGVDASPAMLARAIDRAAGLGLTVDLAPADADRLPFPDAGADTVVATLLLCSVPRVETTLAEFARVLRPGGRLLLLDHVASSSALLRGLQAVADRVTRPTGEYWRRRPLPLLEAAGFRILTVEHSRGRLIETVAAELVSRL
ncbi:MAG: class I SAM-dependent methyltransferase [Propionicimonas sp.]